MIIEGVWKECAEGLVPTTGRQEWPNCAKESGSEPPITRLNAFSITLIPEPSVLLLGCLGLAGLLLVRRRR